jgi:hypothetical protein
MRSLRPIGHRQNASGCLWVNPRIPQHQPREKRTEVPLSLGTSVPTISTGSRQKVLMAVHKNSTAQLEGASGGWFERGRLHSQPLARAGECRWLFLE